MYMYALECRSGWPEIVLLTPALVFGPGAAVASMLSCLAFRRRSWTTTCSGLLLSAVSTKRGMPQEE